MNEQNSHPENPHRKVGVFYCAITSIIEQSRALLSNHEHY
jgi:hypothetical protein